MKLSTILNPGDSQLGYHPAGTPIWAPCRIARAPGLEPRSDPDPPPADAPAPAARSYNKDNVRVQRFHDGLIADNYIVDI